MLEVWLNFITIMRKSILCILVIALAASGDAQPLVIYNKVARHKYMSLVHNEETNTKDTLYLTLKVNRTFIIRRTGAWDAIVLAGKWDPKKGGIALTNRHPDNEPLSVRVVPYTDSCNGYFPGLIDSTGKIRYDFHMNANGYTYNSGMIIPYAELDSIRSRIKVCANFGYFCSNEFSIPYNDCYRIIIDMEFEPQWYNGAIRELYFRKETRKLILDKTGPPKR